MKIGSLLRAAVIISIGLAALLGWILFSTFEQVNRATERGTVAAEIVQGTLNQNILASDYLLHREERARTLWNARHDSLTELVRQAEREFETSKERAILNTIREDHESSQAIFSELITTFEMQASGSEEIAKSQAIEEGLTAQLLLKSQEMVSAASLLAETSRKEIEAAQKRAAVFVVVFLVIMAVFGIAMLMFFSRKVLKPITQLQRGAEIIGEGDLDYRTRITSRDEIGGLSRAFDQMTENLKAITASREELEREVAERRRVEEALRDSNQTLVALIQASPLAIIAHDGDAKVRMWNPAAQHIFGWSEQEVVGRPYPLVPEEKLDEFRMNLERSLRGEALTGLETRRQRKDGAQIDVGIWTGPLSDGGAMVVIADITERKRAEELLLQQMRELAIVEERNRLAREIHDTLAQGLTAIIWQLNAAEKIVESGGEQALQSLDRVRNLAREGLQEARRSVWDLRVGSLEGHTLAEALQGETEKVAGAGEIQASFVVSGAERVLPAGVEAALLRICQESLANMLKHANASQAAVTLVFDDSQVRLEVQDNGIGFDPEIPHTRGPDSGGFGLINMRERARLLGGELTVHSEPGQGSIVEATLSLK